MTDSNFFVSGDEILGLWEKDCIIDRAKLPEESRRIPQLHSKYTKFWRDAKVAHRKAMADLKRLRLDKYEWYTVGPSKETKGKGWTSAKKGLLAKGEAMIYVDSDADVLFATELASEAEDVVKLLEGILEMIRKRSFHINGAVASEKLILGED